MTVTPELVFPGIWRFTFGQPEAITPVQTRRYPPAAEALQQLLQVEECPVVVYGMESARGYQIGISLAHEEKVYGLGLHLKSFQQNGLKKLLRVNADPQMDTGDSHAPVPFYATTRGYGVLIDTARYPTFYCGNRVRRQEKPQGDRDDSAAMMATGENPLPLAYSEPGRSTGSEVLVDIPRCSGITVYVFAGPSLREAVQRYNLFSGGGTLPPRWGLGFWYRGKTEYRQSDILALAAELREREIPCDVLGLEPGWQTQAYSCSFVWSERFPQPQALLSELKTQGFRVNLWEHAFTHPTSPLYPELMPYSGDYEVWKGLVPDFLTPQARAAFAAFHEREHVALGISGYKLDECDNSDFTGNWSFPEVSQFPSGADGEQMHSLLGMRYQDALQDVFEARQEPTYGLVRNAHALAAPYPYVLYSDLYDHGQFIHGIAQSSFSGLLWTPEVRHAIGPEDLVRRLQSVVFSPLAMVNAWYLWNPPWKQVDRTANNAGQFAPDWEELEALCREVITWRMQFIPYLHAAFVRYQREGLPPFRALVMDYPEDPEVAKISDQYLMGESLLVAPVVAGVSARTLYLPEGDWFDFWTGDHYAGQQYLTMDVPLDQIPLFVKGNTLLPLAQKTLHTGDPASNELTVLVFGDGSLPTVLFEEESAESLNLGEVHLNWDPIASMIRMSHTPGTTARYTVREWQRMSSSPENR